MRQLKKRNGTSTQSLNRFELNIQYFKIRKNREKNNKNRIDIENESGFKE